MFKKVCPICYKRFEWIKILLGKYYRHVKRCKLRDDQPLPGFIKKANYDPD